MDWYALDEANKKDGHYRRKPLEISSLEVELESAVAALRQAEKRIAELEAENNRLAELNDKAVFIQFENEDELPADISNDVYSTMFNCSHVDGVRLFPYIEENGQKYFLVMLREDE